MSCGHSQRYLTANSAYSSKLTCLECDCAALRTENERLRAALAEAEEDSVRLLRQQDELVDRLEQMTEALRQREKIIKMLVEHYRQCRHGMATAEQRLLNALISLQPKWEAEGLVKQEKPAEPEKGAEQK